MNKDKIGAVLFRKAAYPVVNAIRFLACMYFYIVLCRLDIDNAVNAYKIILIIRCHYMQHTAALRQLFLNIRIVALACLHGKVFVILNRVHSI